MFFNSSPNVSIGMGVSSQKRSIFCMRIKLLERDNDIKTKRVLWGVHLRRVGTTIAKQFHDSQRRCGRRRGRQEKTDLRRKDLINAHKPELTPPAGSKAKQKESYWGGLMPERHNLCQAPRTARRGDRHISSVPVTEESRSA